MRIGLCTTDFAHAMPADQLFRRVKEMGFSVVQLAFCSVAECGFNSSKHIEIPASVPEVAVAAIRSASDKYGVSIEAVNGTFNMAHPDELVREEGLSRFDGFLKGVVDVGAAIASVCTGTRSCKSLWSWDAATAGEDAYRDLLSVMRRAVTMAEARGVTLAIETEISNVIDTPDKARRLLDDVGSANMKMILDCANLFHPGEASVAAMRPRIDLAIDRFGADIVLAHGKDVRPSAGIDFCGAGEGCVDFPYMLQKLTDCGYRGPMVLHGIYTPSAMPGCLSFMRNCFAQAGVSET